MSISAADFTFVSTLVRQRSAIDLRPGKEYLVESRLAPIVRTAGGDLVSLVQQLRRGDEQLSDQVVDALTTNETSFFRDARLFDAFLSHLIPEVAASATGKRLTIWSAASSSGQEAYSLAMLLLKWQNANPGWSFRILGTDISQKMIAKAQAGRYSQLEVNRGLPANLLVEHFEQRGRDWFVKDDVRGTCQFSRGNLAQPPRGIPSCDVVFLRNVLIYFDSEMKSTVLQHVASVLRPNGLLVLGAAESALTLDEAFQRVDLGNAIVFRRKG